MISRLMVVVAACALLAGCSQEGESKSQRKVKRDLANYSTLDETDVLVQVGTNKLTKADVDAFINFRIAALRGSSKMSGGKINRMAVMAPIVAQAPLFFRVETAWLTWAQTNGVTVTKEKLADFEKRFMQSFGKKNTKFKDFLKRFDKNERKYVRRRIWAEAMADTAHKKYLNEHPIRLTKEDVDKLAQNLRAYNLMASATNALIWAKATNIWNQVKQGADFAALADKYSEDISKSDGGDWGSFRLSDLANDGVLDKTVAALKVGEVSCPVEADNGLNLIKLVDKANGQDGERYELARIFFQLPEIYEEPPVAEIEKEMRKHQENQAIMDLAQKLMANDGVVYPLGEKMFETARKQMRMPMMLQQEGM